MTASATGTCRGTSGSRAWLLGSDAPIEPLRRLNRKLVLLAGRTGNGRLRRRCRRDRRRWPCRKRLFAQLQPFWRQCFDGNEHVGPGRIDRGDLRSQYKCESGLEHSDRTTLGSPETPSSPMRFSVGARAVPGAVLRSSSMAGALPGVDLPPTCRPARYRFAGQRLTSFQVPGSAIAATTICYGPRRRFRRR